VQLEDAARNHRCATGSESRTSWRLATSTRSTILIKSKGENMKSLSAASAAMGLCALLLAPDVFAYQPLCSNSPENPTCAIYLARST